MSLTAASRARILIIAGGLFVVLALVLGSQKVMVQDTRCGSAFGASIGVSSASVYGSQTVQDCRDRISERRFIALGFVLLGVSGLVGGGYLQRRSSKD